jgi:phosphoglycerate dehydrogenase-like enzyme
MKLAILADPDFAPLAQIPRDVEISDVASGRVGYGGTGQAVGRRATALGMSLVPIRRQNRDLPNLLERSDYVVVSTPLTAATRRSIGVHEIDRMKPTRYSSTSAAERSSTKMPSSTPSAPAASAVRRSMSSRSSLLPPDSPLWTLDNVLLSPHSADHTADAHDRAMTFFLENLQRFRRGEPLENVVDNEAGY